MQTSFSADLDEMASECVLLNEKAKKAMIDAARLAEELRVEQEAAQLYEKDRKLWRHRQKDLQTRLNEAEQMSLKGGKKAMGKMDTRIRELESELDAELDVLMMLRRGSEKILSARSRADLPAG